MRVRRNRKKKAKPKPQALPGSIAAYANEYYEWMTVKNYSPATVSNRETYLNYFVVWAEEHGILEPVEVTKPVIERYQQYLFHYRKKRDNLSLSFRSQNARLVAVRAYFKWLARQNYMLYNPASEIEMPKTEKRLPKNALSIGEAEQVLNVPDVKELTGIRDRAILEVLYSTGMRRMEIIDLGLYSIDVERGTVIVYGKGKKERFIPISERAIQWVHKYLYEVRPHFALEPDNNVLFITVEGEMFTRNRLTQMVRNYVNASGVEKKGSCHMFRHNCATLMLEGGADVRFIQQMLGHADLSTTQIYTQVSIQKLKAVHDLTHPGAKKRDKDEKPEKKKESGSEKKTEENENPPENQSETPQDTAGNGEQPEDPENGDKAGNR